MTVPAASGDNRGVATGRDRSRQTVGDIVRSLAVVLAVVAVLVVFNAVQEPEERVRALDYPQVLQDREAELTFAPVGPMPLPPGWRVTSARSGQDGEVSTWHLGMVTSSGTYAAVEQSDGPVTDLVARHTEGARRAGAARVGGQSWQRYAGGDPEPRALVRRDGDVVTMVTGAASWAELTSAAATLAPAPAE